MRVLTWKIGFEVELVAPRGVSRADLAARVAQRIGGKVHRRFHQQAEPSKASNVPIFENLTLGFQVSEGDKPVASFVDDLTLQRDLDREASPADGWYRIVADDARILRLVCQHCDPAAPLETVLNPLAALFATTPQTNAGMVRVRDDEDRSVAIAAPLPGERERPCETVTAPIERDHAKVLEELLTDARALGFAAPIEGATHLHFDATALQSASTIATLVDVLWRHGDALKAMFGANPNCVRLGSWPEALPQLTKSQQFRALRWRDAQAALRKVGLSKFCDYNLLNVALGTQTKHTFEVRILPTHLTAAPIIEAAALFEALLGACAGPQARQLAECDSLSDLLAALRATS
ncbi:MAG: amidoligase family protein [Hyphomonadaceae bacterium]|nr:amidoligase family protein [Hyphomonadaceae bacterium]